MALIEEKMIANWLRWFEHGQGSPLKTLARRVNCMVFSLAKRGRGRPTGTLEDIVKRDFMVNNIPKNLVFNQPNGIM